MGFILGVDLDTQQEGMEASDVSIITAASVANVLDFSALEVKIALTQDKPLLSCIIFTPYKALG